LQLTPVADAYISSFQPNANFGVAGDLFVGKTDTATTLRSLLQFDLSAIPSGVTLDQATLRLHLLNGSAAPPLLNVPLYRIDAGWLEMTVTWNNQPAAVLTAISSDVGLTPGYYNWDVLSLVNDWLGGTPNFGLQLRSNDEGLVAFRRFQSGEGSPPPQLVIFYHH
jgi:hypothetical protein